MGETRNPKRTLTWPCEGVHNGGATHFVFPGKGEIGERHTDFSPIKTDRCNIWRDFFLLLHISTKLALGRKNTSFYCLGNEEIHQKWLLKCSVARMFGVVGGQQFGVKDLQQPQKPKKKDGFERGL